MRGSVFLFRSLISRIHAKSCFFAVFLLTLLFFPNSPAFGAETAGSPPLLVGVEYGYPPYSMVDGNGKPMGFAVELMQESLNIMNREFSFIVDSWKNVMQALTEGSIQALPLVGRTPEREALFDFTFPYLTRYGTIVVKDGTPMPEKYEDLRGLRVGVMKGDNAEEFVRRNPVPVEIVTTVTFEEALTLLSRGKIDAVVIQRLLALQLQKQSGLDNLTVGNLILEDFKQSYCFAVTEGNGELLGVLNEGLALVMANGTFDRLQAKWFAQAETARVRDNRLIVGGDEAYPPYEYLDENGRPAGYNVELTLAIAEKMGLEVEIRLGPWNEIYQELLKGEIDIIQGLYYSPERDRTLAFSQPHTLVSHVVVTRKDAPLAEDLSALRDSKILIMRGDITHEFFIREGFEENLILADSQEEALIRLSNGEGDCAIAAQIPAYYWIKKDKISNLTVGTKSILSGEYNYGALEENYRLLLPFTQGLSAIKATGEYHSIASEWLGVYENRMGVTKENLNKMLLFIGLPLLAFFIIIVAWSLTLNHLVEKRTGELKTLTEKLKGSESRYRTYVENAPEGIFITDSQGKYIDVNNAACDMTGYSREELLTLGIADLASPLAGPETLETFPRLKNEGVVQTEIQMRRKDGADFFASLKGVALYGDRLMGFCSDLTEQKTAEEEKEKLQAQLAHSQKLESIGQLAGGIAHDFNNQLSGIMGYAEMLTPGLDDESLTRYADNIRMGAQNSARLTQQLLSFARKGLYTLETINLHEIVDEVIGILVHTIDRRIQIRQVRKAIHPTVQGDRVQIQNALLNIALNARDAITGTGTITFESTLLFIDENHTEGLFELNHGEYVCISIRDDGCGMDGNLQKHIFDPFFTTKEVGKGTGMGLPAAYGTVKHHGGGIFLESRLRVGSTFHILLPHEESEESRAKPAGPLSTAAATANILIVDDDDIIRGLISELLVSLGYRVHGEEDGEKGLAYYREHKDKIDLMILDMIMPKMSGEEIFYAVREINPRAKILISSGYSTEDESISKIVGLGVPFIQKPCSLSELSELVAKILKGA